MNKLPSPQQLVTRRIAELASSHPDWMEQYENADFSVSSVTEELIELLESAPSGFAAGLVYGKLATIQASAGIAKLRSPVYRNPLFQSLLNHIPQSIRTTNHAPHRPVRTRAVAPELQQIAWSDTQH